MARYNELKAYKRKIGDCNVPVRWKANPQLGKWVSNQRGIYKNGKLEDDRVAKLNELGFQWEVIDDWWTRVFQRQWMARYNELKAYKRKIGDCNVPQEYEANRQLGNWVSNQRGIYKNGKLADDRVAKLNELGFQWEVLVTEDWWTRYDQLVAYHKDHGHCNVPSQDEANRQLGKWVSRQRYLNKKGELEDDRVAKLNELGFVWNSQDQSWQKRYGQLVAYHKDHGHCNVPSQDEDRQLVRWVKTQREFKKDGKLADDRVAKLNELGFQWR
jgi:hypothetical protein